MDLLVIQNVTRCIDLYVHTQKEYMCQCIHMCTYMYISVHICAYKYNIGMNMYTCVYMSAVAKRRAMLLLMAAQISGNGYSRLSPLPLMRPVLLLLTRISSHAEGFLEMPSLTSTTIRSSGPHWTRGRALQRGAQTNALSVMTVRRLSSMHFPCRC